MLLKKATEQELVRSNNKTGSLALDHMLSTLFNVCESNVIYKVIDEDGVYNNNNDLRRSIQTRVSKDDLQVSVFMLNGNVFVVKEE